MGSINMKKKKSSKSKVDLQNIESIIEMLNNKKTTIEVVLNKLQDFVENFQHAKEDLYIEDLKDQLEKSQDEIENDEEIERWTNKIQHLVNKDTKEFVYSYVKNMNDKILDAVNDKKLKKDPGYAFLMLLQIMEKAVVEKD